MSDVIEATATIVNNDIVSQTELEQWLAKKSAEVHAVLGSCNISEINNSTDYKNAKSARAELNRVVKSVDDERKAKVSALQTLVRRLKAEADGVTEEARKRSDEIKALIDEADDRDAADKLAQLAQAYEDYAPALVPLVPFNKIVGLIGQKWGNRSEAIGKCHKELRQFINKLAADERLIDGMPYTEEEREELKADYFNVLDLGQAQRVFTERKEAMERYAELQAERQAFADQAEQDQPAAAAPQADTENTGASEAPQQAAQKQNYIFRVVVPAEKLQAFLDAMHNIGGISGREIKE